MEAILYPNALVQVLRTSPWTLLLKLSTHSAHSKHDTYVYNGDQFWMDMNGHNDQDLHNRGCFSPSSHQWRHYGKLRIRPHCQKWNQCQKFNRVSATLWVPSSYRCIVFFPFLSVYVVASGSAVLAMSLVNGPWSTFCMRQLLLHKHVGLTDFPP